MNVPLGNSRKKDRLVKRMTELGVHEVDIEETFTSYSSKMTTPICVMLLHRPSGLNVKCQATPDRERNRFLAREILMDKIERSQKYSSRPRQTKYINLVLAIILLTLALILVAFFSSKGFFGP